MNISLVMLCVGFGAFIALLGVTLGFTLGREHCCDCDHDGGEES